MSRVAIERQTVVTWRTPQESLPEEHQQVVVSMSGYNRNTVWQNCLAIAFYDDEVGWVLDNLDPDLVFNKMTIHAWADLVPYGGER